MGPQNVLTEIVTLPYGIEKQMITHILETLLSVGNELQFYIKV